MVTSFGPLAKLVKKNVSKVTSEKEVWAQLAKWKFIAESDLTDSFHQLVLKRDDKSIPLSNTNVDCPSYMCFKTPYKQAATSQQHQQLTLILLYGID